MRILRVLGAALGVAALPLLLIPRAEAADDGPVVRSYEATYDVGRNGAARVVETVRVRFDEAGPGITRGFDASDPNWTPRDLQVTQDGRPARITTTRDGDVLRVGVGSGSLSRGVHVYRFSYRYDDVLETANDDPAKAVLHWFAIAPDWGMRMNASRIEVRLPNPADDVTCTTRPARACAVEESATGFTVSTGRLAPRTPVEIRTVFAPQAALATTPSPSATPTPSPTPSPTPTPSPSATAEPSSQVAGPPAEVVTPDADADEGSAISGTAVMVTLALVLLVAAGLVWLMSRRSGTEDESTETLSFLADDVVDGEVMDDGPEVEDELADDDAEPADAVDAEIVEESADK